MSQEVHLTLKPRELWQKSAKNCSKCNAKFSIVRGVNVHHCRLCGLSFCIACAGKKINSSIIQSINQSINQSNPADISVTSSEKVRVCDGCFDKCTGHMVDAAINQSSSSITDIERSTNSVSQSDDLSINSDGRRRSLDQSVNQSINRFLRERKKRAPMMMPITLDEHVIDQSVDQTMDQSVNPLNYRGKGHSRTPSVDKSVSRSTDQSGDPMSPSIGSRSFASLTQSSSTQSIHPTDFMSPHSRINESSNPPSPLNQLARQSSSEPTSQWDLSTVPSVADLSISPAFQAFKHKSTTLHQTINQSISLSNKHSQKQYRAQKVDAIDRLNHVKLIVQSIKQSISQCEAQALSESVDISSTQSSKLQELHDRLAFFNKQVADYTELIDWLDQSINQPDPSNRLYKLRLVDRVEKIMVDVVDCLIDRLIGSLRLMINHGKISIELLDCSASVNLVNLMVNAINQSNSQSFQTSINQSLLKGLSSLVKTDRLSINLSIKRIFIPVSFVSNQSSNQSINHTISPSGDWLVNEAGAVYDIQIVKPAVIRSTSQSADQTTSQSKSYHESLINWLIKRYLPRTINQAINKSIPAVLGPFFSSLNQSIVIEGLIDCKSDFPTIIWDAPLHHPSVQPTNHSAHHVSHHFDHSEQARSLIVQSIDQFNQSHHRVIDQSPVLSTSQSTDQSQFLWRMQLLSNMLQAGKFHKSSKHASNSSISQSIHQSNNLFGWSHYVRSYSTCLNNQSDWMRLMIGWQQSINEIEQFVFQSTAPSDNQFWFFDFVSAVARADDKPINLSIKLVNLSVGFSIVEATKLYNDSIKQAINQSIENLKKKESDKKAKLSAIQSNNLGIKQSTKQTHTPTPVNQSINRAITETINQSRPRSYSSPVTSPTNRSFLQATNQSDFLNVNPGDVPSDNDEPLTPSAQPTIMIDLDQSRKQSVDSSNGLADANSPNSFVNQSKEHDEISRLMNLSVTHERDVNRLVVRLIDLIKQCKFTLLGELNGECTNEAFDQIVNPAKIKLSIEQLSAALSMPSIVMSINQSIQMLSQSIYQIPSLKLSTSTNASSGAFEALLQVFDSSAGHAASAHLFKLVFHSLALNLFPSFKPSSSSQSPIEISLAHVGVEGPLKPLIDQSINQSINFDVQSFSKVLDVATNLSASQSIEQTMKDEIAKSGNQADNQTDNQSLLKLLSANQSVDYQAIYQPYLIDRSHAMRVAVKLGLAITPGDEYRLLTQSTHQSTMGQSHPANHQPNTQAVAQSDNPSRSHSRHVTQTMDLQSLSSSSDHSIPLPLPVRPKPLIVEQFISPKTASASSQPIVPSVKPNDQSESKTAAEMYATQELTPGGSAAIVTVDQATNRIHIPPPTDSSTNPSANLTNNQSVSQSNGDAVDQPINISIQPVHQSSDQSIIIDSGDDQQVRAKLKQHEYVRIDIGKPVKSSSGQSADDSCFIASFRATLVELINDSMALAQ